MHRALGTDTFWMTSWCYGSPSLAFTSQGSSVQVGVVVNGRAPECHSGLSPDGQNQRNEPRDDS